MPRNPHDDDYSSWQDRLTPEQFRVTRLGGTEAAFSGEYRDRFDVGLYRCACCNAALFRSDAKYDSGTGWPSFSAPADVSVVEQRAESMFLVRRTEVLCTACSAHLGHLFNDGPPPTGMRYCINSLALRFEPEADGPGDAERRPVRHRKQHR